MRCEDYPCCGHTDGLGCDWVSPNEIQPCNVCIEARASYPYHDGWPGSCPTANRKARQDVPEGAECECPCRFCEGKATVMLRNAALCDECHDMAADADRWYRDSMEDQY